MTEHETFQILHGKNDNFEPVFEPVLGPWIMNMRNEYFHIMFRPGHLSTLAGKSRNCCSAIGNGVVVIMAWWSVFQRLRHPETNTIAPKLNDIPSGICIACRALGYERYKLPQIYSRAFFAVFSNFFIYSQLPYNISNSRFQIKFWVLIDTKSCAWYMFQWRSWLDIGMWSLRSAVQIVWLPLQVSLKYHVQDHRKCLLFGVTNRAWFFCFIQPWLQTWMDGASLGKKDKPTKFRSTIGLSAASSSWIFSQSPNDFWRCVSVIELQYAPSS